MLPSRRGTRPMMLFMVVVLPAPLRPSSVTTSPSCTSKSTPCRMWLSPYQAFSPLIASMASGIWRPEIGGDDVRVAAHAGIVPLGQDLPAREHRDAVAQALDHAQIVLDHQDGPARAD